MFKKDIQVYKKAITLAQAVSEEYKSNHCGDKVATVSDKIDELFTRTDKEKALQDYLEAQDYEVVKNMMVIMYLGIDQFYDETQSPEEIFKQQRKGFEKNWDEKDVIIDQMTSKIPLGTYLQNGLKRLGIE